MPTPNTKGNATFGYTIRDTGGLTASATVTVTVNNRNPTTSPDTKSTGFNAAVSFPATDLSGNDADPDGQTLTVTAVTNGNGGTATLSGGTVTFTPNTGFTGNASFTYMVSDGLEGTATGTVSVTVGANMPPITGADSANTFVNHPVQIAVSTLLGNDRDPESQELTLTAVAPDTGGTVVLNGGTVTFTPTANTAGTARFTYTVQDGGGATATGSVQVTVTNRAPVAGTDSATTPFNRTATIPVADLLSNDSDPDGQTFTITAVASDTGGTANLSGASVSFVPTTNFNGPARFTYTLADTLGATAIGIVNVGVGANMPPVATADTAATTFGRAVAITASSLLANDFDPDGNTLMLTGVTSGTGGTVSLADGTATFTPAPGFIGAAAFSYTISDGAGGTARSNNKRLHDPTRKAMKVASVLALLGISFGFAAMPMSGAGFSADARVLVITSSGPSAPRFPAGTILHEPLSVTLRNGDELSLLDAQGIREVTGPATIRDRPAGATNNVVARPQADRRPTVAAVRKLGRETANAAAEGHPASTRDNIEPTELWLITIKPGQWCIPAHETPMFWRSDAGKGTEVAVSALERGDVAKVRWARNARTVEWPVAIDFVDGGQYGVRSGNQAEALMLFHILPSDWTSIDDMVTKLRFLGCDRQADRLAG